MSKAKIENIKVVSEAQYFVTIKGKKLGPFKTEQEAKEAGIAKILSGKTKSDIIKELAGLMSKVENLEREIEILKQPVFKKKQPWEYPYDQPFTQPVIYTTDKTTPTFDSFEITCEGSKDLKVGDTFSEGSSTHKFKIG
jgi:hypothetical protein